jgi:hypothetical protein
VPFTLSCATCFIIEEDLWTWLVGFPGAQLKSVGNVPIRLVEGGLVSLPQNVAVDDGSWTDKPGEEGAP